MRPGRSMPSSKMMACCLPAVAGFPSREVAAAARWGGWGRGGNDLARQRCLSPGLGRVVRFRRCGQRWRRLHRRSRHRHQPQPERRHARRGELTYRGRLDELDGWPDVGYRFDSVERQSQYGCFKRVSGSEPSRLDDQRQRDVHAQQRERVLVADRLGLQRRHGADGEWDVHLSGH